MTIGPSSGATQNYLDSCLGRLRNWVVWAMICLEGSFRDEVWPSSAYAGVGGSACAGGEGRAYAGNW